MRSDREDHTTLKGDATAPRLAMQRLKMADDNDRVGVIEHENENHQPCNGINHSAVVFLFEFSLNFMLQLSVFMTVRIALSV